MEVVFTTIQKRENSTKRPTAGDSYDCVLKSASSIINPTIELVWIGTTGDPSQYNYCRIPRYERYYWVKNWTYQDRKWIANCVVDVLATFKDYIGAASKYVLRSASDYDPDVLDNRYPAVSRWGGYPRTFSFPWTTYGATAEDAKNIVVTIIGKNTRPAGNYITQAAMSPESFQLLINNLMDKISSEIQSAQQQSNFGDVMRDLFLIPSRMTDDLMRYVTNVMWFPFAPGSGAPAETLRAGIHDVLANDLYLWVTNPVHRDTGRIYVGDIVNGDDWEYAAPFATYFLHLMPFGDIALDSFDVINSEYINLEIDTDTISGVAVLRIYADPGGEQLPRLLTTRSAQLGMALPYGGTSFNLAGMVQGGVGIASAVNSFMEGTGGAGAIVGSVANAASMSQPNVYATGATGSGASITGVASLWYRVMYHTQLDVAEIGRPLCRIRTISTLSGYIECRDGELEAPATQDELAAIKSYLTGGFFYE